MQNRKLKNNKGNKNKKIMNGQMERRTFRIIAQILKSSAILLRIKEQTER